ncbi:glycoside hydrolase family 38 [Termitidicoccus mucosus]|uniref:Glycoside hydrolase family 38 n=1 Tax=Termitidicoccus mucosus TaxID=1184151 RepID=A0A178IDQ4_9BACT|nr:glycoside hydrolase family 38 [Opitutaceae bacterium TSB47]
MRTIHLIGNAHIDPAWLWDWREGMNEAIATCNAMVSLLHEFPDFRFIRGEAAIYDYVERNASGLFREISRLVAEGRWDVVGGTWIQPDNNLPSTEALVRQFNTGKRYFREKFGVEITAAWSADAFGHSAGLPDILAAAGMDSFACTRPQAHILALDKQAFWWQGQGARILAFRPHDGWYASERADLGKRLDECLVQAGHDDLDNVAMFYGLGNHGGGPTRAHMRTIQEWARRHPEVCVEHSGLHRFFAALRKELAAKGESFIPTHRGELNFCLRGCSASMARFKYSYRHGEAYLARGERMRSLVTAICADVPAFSLDEAWRTLLFSAFHDILPGTVIEHAADDQLAQMGGVIDAASRCETVTLLGLARSIDTGAGMWELPEDHPLPQPVLIWNPHPWEIEEHVEIEVSLDNRPLWNYSGTGKTLPFVVVERATGRVLPHQDIPVVHDSLVDLIWRRRVVVPVSIPSCGWSLLHVGLDPLGMLKKEPGAKSREMERRSLLEVTIKNKHLYATAKVGASSITFEKGGAAWLGDGLQVRVYEDRWGAWGGMLEERDSWLLTKEVERWTVSQSAILEEGPEVSRMWVRFEGAHSHVELILSLARDSGHVDIHARVLLNDRGVRLKLVIPASGAEGLARFAVPGGSVWRSPCGEVPGGRWVSAGAGADAVGFASDALYGFDTTETELRATIARTSRYGGDVHREPQERPWQPCMDIGDLKFRALLTPEIDSLERLADQLQEPLVVQTVPITKIFSPEPASFLPAKGSLFSVESKAVRVLAICPGNRDSIELRLQNTSNAPLSPLVVNWLGKDIELGHVDAFEIATWEMRRADGGTWTCERTVIGAS